MKNAMGAFNSVLVNFVHSYTELWVNYRDNRDIKQHYRDMRISVIAQPYLKLYGMQGHIKMIKGRGGKTEKSSLATRD